MLKKLVLTCLVGVSLIVGGCGPRAIATGYAGTYSMVVTPDLEKLIKDKEAKVKEAKAKADKGDVQAKHQIEQLGGKIPDIEGIAKSIKLEIKQDGTFAMSLDDPYSGSQTVEGSVIINENKLTLQPEKINGKSESDKSKLAALVMAWDEKTKQLTAESGSGPRLVLKKD